MYGEGGTRRLCGEGWLAVGEGCGWDGGSGLMAGRVNVGNMEAKMADVAPLMLKI